MRGSPEQGEKEKGQEGAEGKVPAGREGETQGKGKAEGVERSRVGEKGNGKGGSIIPTTTQEEGMGTEDKQQRWRSWKSLLSM